MSVAPQATQICVPTGIGIIARTPPAHPPGVPRMPLRRLPARAGPGHCATPPRSLAQRRHRSPSVAQRYSPPQPQPAQSALLGSRLMQIADLRIENLRGMLDLAPQPIDLHIGGAFVG